MVEKGEKDKPDEVVKPKAETEEQSELEKFQELGARAGINTVKMFAEVRGEFGKEIDERLKTAMPLIFKELKGLVGDIDGRITTQVAQEVQRAVNLLAAEFQKKLQGSGGNTETALAATGSRGNIIDSILANLPQLLDVWTKIKQPSSPQAVMGEMNTILQWHSLLSRLEKGAIPSEQIPGEITKAITPKPEEK